MATHPEVLALARLALQHLLSEQGKLLKRKDAQYFTKIHISINDLAAKILAAMDAGIKRTADIKRLQKLAVEIEKKTDDLSVQLWTPVFLSVSSIYVRMEESIIQSSQPSLSRNLRDQFNNFRVRLLEQTQGAKMLIQNSDLGDEHERIWQQFLQKQLGSDFQVVRGGHILSQDGSASGPQVDIIIVQAGASVIVPGDSDGGKANVFVDDVIAAILLTSNLTEDKLRRDWERLQLLPIFEDKEKDYSSLKDHTWPLCYFLAAQSCDSDDLEKNWIKAVKEGHTKVVPQLLISLDGCSMFSGAIAWPRPRSPSNYKQSDQIKTWTGLEAGLGLAWMLLQIKGRLRVIQHRPLGPITRYANLLNASDIKHATPPTWSKRFDTMFQAHPIAGICSWGSHALFVHNRFQVRSIDRNFPGATKRTEVELFKAGVDVEQLRWEQHGNHLRWFRYGVFHLEGELLALEEWIDPESKIAHQKRIAVFNHATGEELTGSQVEALSSVTDIASLTPGPAEV